MASLSIALFTETYHPMRNGVVTAVSSLAHTLRAMGHEVTICTAHHPDEATAGEDGVIRFPSLMLPSKARYPLAMPFAPKEKREFLLRKPFDILHSHTMLGMGCAALAYHWRRGIPLVFTYHTMVESYTHYFPLPQEWVRQRAAWVTHMYCNTVDHIITPSRFVADLLRKNRVRKPITPIPTGIDIVAMNQVPAGSIRAQYAIPEDYPLLAYAGRMAKEKNIGRIVNAFTEVVQVEPNAHLLLIGGGPAERKIRALLERRHLSSRSRITGYVSHEHVVQCLRESNIFVFASHSETQGLVIGEAMACGLPVVSIEAGAQRELITSGEEGFLVPDADEPFATAILRLIRDPEIRRCMGHKARQRSSGLTAQHCAEQHLDVYYRSMASLD